MTCSNPLPGYDAWKLASPYDDEHECERCGRITIDYFRHCTKCRCEPDPDEANERLRAERDARPGDADYVAPIDDDNIDF